MSGAHAPAYEAVARLLEYPTAEFAGRVDACRALVRDACPAAAAHVDAFAAATAPLGVAKLEELFIQTFDFNPKSTLDIGWQLFAEDYNRGLFLAKLRAESRRLGVTETRELPDHLTHVLRLLARLEPAAADDFAFTCVLPAVEKTLGALDEANPYRRLIQCVFTLMGAVHSPQAEVVES